MPKNDAEQLSKLEQDLRALLEGQRDLEQQQTEQLAMVLERMARQEDRHVVISSYPACNSG